MWSEDQPDKHHPWDAESLAPPQTCRVATGILTRPQLIYKPMRGSLPQHLWVNAQLPLAPHAFPLQLSQVWHPRERGDVPLGPHCCFSAGPVTGSWERKIILAGTHCHAYLVRASGVPQPTLHCWNLLKGQCRLLSIVINLPPPKWVLMPQLLSGSYVLIKEYSILKQLHHSYPKWSNNAGFCKQEEMLVGTVPCSKPLKSYHFYYEATCLLWGSDNCDASANPQRPLDALQSREGSQWEAADIPASTFSVPEQTSSMCVLRSEPVWDIQG